MNLNAILVGTLGFLLSGALGLLVSYFSFWVFSRTTRNLDELQELKKNNQSVGILLASIIVANGLVVKQVLFPVMSTFRNALHGTWASAKFLSALGYGLAYLALAQLSALTMIILGIHLFAWLTRGLDDMDEIRNNNFAVALTLGGVILVLGMFLSEGLQALLSALVPSPSIDTLHVFGK